MAADTALAMEAGVTKLVGPIPGQALFAGDAGLGAQLLGGEDVDDPLGDQVLPALDLIEDRLRLLQK